MKKTVTSLISFLFYLFCLQVSWSQEFDETKKSSKNMTRWGYGNELLGAAHLWSFALQYRPHFNFMITTGFSYILIPGINTYNADFFIVPLLGSYMYGIGNHFAELQLGALIVSPAELGKREAGRSGHRASATSEWLVPLGSIGYRYQPEKAGWFFKVAVYGVFGRDPTTDIREVRPWPGISLGRTF